MLQGKSILIQAEKDNTIIGNDVHINPEPVGAKDNLSESFAPEREDSAEETIGAKEYDKDGNFIRNVPQKEIENRHLLADSSLGGLSDSPSINQQISQYYEWDPEVNKMMPKKPIVIDDTQGAVNHYLYGNGEPVVLGPKTQSYLRNSERQKNALEKLKSGNTAMSGLYGINLTNDIFHVGDTGVAYDTQCNNGMCTTTFKGFVQKGPNGTVIPDSFSDPLDIGAELPNRKPFNYYPYIWQETYPDKFNKKK